MARPVSSGSRLMQLDQFPAIPKITPVPKLFFQPPAGMSTAARLDMIGPSLARLVQNLTVRDGAYKTRDAVDYVGTSAGAPLMYATEVRLSNGDSWLLRWKENGLEYYEAGSWYGVVGGSSVTGYSSSNVVVTGWNDTLVFSTNTGKCWSLDFDPTPTVTELTESPENVIHLTTFAGRVIASITGTRIQWCIRNDNTDWTGLGSGFEDLLGSPGGSVDSQCGVIPVSDEIALVIRSNSVWQMSQTGNFDAPFNFGLIHASIGSISPMTLCATPYGGAFMSRDNVVVISPSGQITKIGDPIRRTIMALDNVYKRRACMVYDAREDELRLSIPDGDGSVNQKVWRYNQAAQAWTQDSFQFGIRAISFTRYAQSTLTIDGMDTLSGTIDGLTGIIDDLGVNDQTVGCIYTMADDAQRVGRDSVSRNNTASGDTDGAGLYVPRGWRIESGYIIPGSTLEKTDIIEIQLEYESEGSQDLVFEYSEDGGTTWYEFDRVSVTDTNDQALVLSVRKHIYRDRVQLAVSCEDAKTFRLIGMHVLTASGARITDAS